MRTALRVTDLLLVLLLSGCGSGSPGEGPTSPPPEKPAGDTLVRVTDPAPGATVRSPLTIRGEARGYYYFEADFPVRLETTDGTVLATAPARAGADWMTEDWVPFSATLSFDPPSDSLVYLILERANPSGLPENAHELRVAVRVIPPTE